MNKRYRPLAIAAFVAAALIFAIQLDPLVEMGFTRSSYLASASELFNFIGNGAFLVPLCVALYIIGTRMKGTELRSAGAQALLSFILSGVAAHMLKAAFERPRMAHTTGALDALMSNPSFFDLTGRFNSFPSGHSAAAFSVAYALSRRYPHLSFILYPVAVLVALSRVYLGSHYPTDVVVGALLGVLAAYLVTCTGEVRRKWLFSGFVLLVVFMSFFKSGSFLLFDVDEAVFSEASREMVETGDYITPTYNYEPRYDKPILFYWFMSAAFKLFGVTEFAARFTSGFFGVCLVCMTFLFIKRARGELPAYLCSLALLLNLEFFVYSHSAVTDMTLAFFLTASFFAFYLAVSEGDDRWFTAFWVAAALATLTKGAIGLIFPVMVAFLFIIATRRYTVFKAFFKPLNLLIYFLVTAPWFAIETYINGWDFFNAFIIKHHIKRYSDVISSHGGPPYYYLGILLLGFFPWAALLPGGLYRGFKEFREKEAGLYLFASIWFAFVFVFFSISKTKLPNYIFPLFPAASILAGLTFSDFFEEREGAGWRGFYGLAGVAAVLSVAMFALPSMDVRMDVALPASLFYITGVIFALIAVFGALTTRLGLRSFVSICVLTAAFIVVMRLCALPPANIFLQRTLYDYSVYSRVLGPDDVLATYEINMPSIAFYARRKVEKIENLNLCNIEEHAKRSRVLLITTPSHYESVAELKALEVVDQRGKYILLGTEGFEPLP